MNTIIPNSKNLELIKSKIKKDGYKKLHILSDFDRTLTYSTIDGIKTPSIISMLRDGKHLTEDYSAKAHALFDKYHPIETNYSIPLDERKKAMQEWWEAHNKLLVKSGLSLKDLEDIVQNGHLKFREGVAEFLDFLHEQNIPLIIFSASGAGDVIELFFKKIGKNYSNIYYITNKFNWNENGKAISTKGTLIHSLNKDETILPDIPEVYQVVKNRRNVILLGDGIGDLGMITGFDYDNLIKIGFLNSPEFKEEYEKNFDVILEGDGDFSFVNEIIKSLE